MSSRIGSVFFAASVIPWIGCSSAHHTNDSTTTSAVLAGACIVDSLSASNLSNCKNLSAYSTCATAMCDFQSCKNACTDFESCIATSDDPCNNGCVQSAACENCLSPVATCSANQCLGTLSCGTAADGGACDKLDTCCRGATDALKMTCQLAAQAARIGGDPSCQTLLTAPAPTDASATLFGCAP